MKSIQRWFGGRRTNGDATIMSLPTELRSEILKYVLIEDDPICFKLWKRSHSSEKDQIVRVSYRDYVDQPQTTWRRRWRLSSTVTPIRYVNRQIRAEAIQVLYGYNRFAFQNTVVLMNFLEGLKEHARYVRYVEIGEADVARSHFRTAMFNLTALKGLRKLSLSHTELCQSLDRGDLEYYYAQPVQSLLRSLETTYKKHGGVGDVLEIVSITPKRDSRFRCSCSMFNGYYVTDATRQHLADKRNAALIGALRSYLNKT